MASAKLEAAEAAVDADDLEGAAEILTAIGGESWTVPEGWPAEERARFLVIAGGLELARAEFDDAIDAYRSALELQEEADAPAVDRGHTWVRLAVAHADAGDEEEAEATFQRGLSILEETEDASSNAIEAWLDYGFVWQQNADFARAAKAFREAVTRAEAANEEPRELGRIHTIYGMALRPLVSIVDALDEADRAPIVAEARNAFGQAVELLQKAQVPPEELLEAVRGLAEVHARSGAHDEAREAHELALRIAEMTGPDPAVLATLAFERGCALQLAGDHTSACAEIEHAIGLADEAETPPAALARAWNALAESFDALGRGADAAKARARVTDLGGIDDDSVDMVDLQPEKDDGGF